MKARELWPLEFIVPNQKDDIFRLPHPWIKDYFIVAHVRKSESDDVVTVMLLQRVPGKMKAVQRYATLVEANMIRNAFFTVEDRVFIPCNETPYLIDLIAHGNTAPGV